MILADVPPAQSGDGSGIQSMSRQVGSALGIAILGTALTTGLASGTSERLAAASIPAPQRAAVVLAVERSSGAVLPVSAGLRHSNRLSRPSRKHSSRAPGGLL